MSGIDGTLTGMNTGMNWAAFGSAEPDLAKTVESRFGAFTHHVLATLRKDGSPAPPAWRSASCTANSGSA